MVNSVLKQKTKTIYPVIKPRERNAVWEKARGMWENRKPDPIKVLQKMRKDWECSKPKCK